ncbi:MAG: energy-coupling factor transporter ATP-binding protein EcfA2 [Halobacteriales archaeon]|jgi:energy-coupling factor transporter ATP-binding protein EcfA2
MPVLEAESLSVRTADGTCLLDDVDLAVHEDETILLCGGPGAGKSLLAKALVGLLGRRTNLEVDGTVERDGEVGLVFQHPEVQLVRRNVREDVAFGLENRGVDREAMRTRIERHAARLDATGLLDRNVDELSRGETTLVAILGVLVTDPDVLVLDEPLAPLDGYNAGLVLDAIDHLRSRGTSVVVAEHDLRDLLCRGERVVLLDDGRVGDRGEPRSLAPALRETGVKLPFPTELALERGARGTEVPITSDD